MALASRYLLWADGLNTEAGALAGEIEFLGSIQGRPEAMRSVQDHRRLTSLVRSIIPLRCPLGLYNWSMACTLRDVQDSFSLAGVAYQLRHPRLRCIRVTLALAISIGTKSLPPLGRQLSLLAGATTSSSRSTLLGVCHPMDDYDLRRGPGCIFFATGHGTRNSPRYPKPFASPASRTPWRWLAVREQGRPASIRTSGIVDDVLDHYMNALQCTHGILRGVERQQIPRRC